MTEKNKDTKKETLLSQSAFQRLVMPGNSLRIYYGDGNLNNKIIHIRSIVDEEYIVLRTWLKHKKRWSYEVKSVYCFELLFNHGNLAKA